jgi:V8-like Glu-specific endopeptidase
MRWMARRARGTSRSARVVILTLAAAVTYAAVMLVPGYGGAAAITRQPAAPTPPRPAATSGTGTAFGGTPAVGALFSVSDGQLDTHFCTASVVHSPHGDLAVTAAHCVTGIDGQIAFVPGYANGKEPYGTWPVTAVYTDHAWQAAQDPDHDVAFLRLSPAASGKPIESVTGAETLGINAKVPALVRVIGYPDGADQPITCVNRAKPFSRTQLEFDCDGYTDGTSGGPFLAGITSGIGRGTVIGVIGGHEQGGNTPDVSYAAALGPAAAALYRSAEAGG